MKDLNKKQNIEYNNRNCVLYGQCGINNSSQRHDELSKFGLYVLTSYKLQKS